MALASDFNQLLICCFWFYIDALIITVSGRILTGKLKSLSSKQKMPTLIGRYLKPLLTLLAWGKEAWDWGPHHRKVHDSPSCCHPQSVTWYRKKNSESSEHYSDLRPSACTCLWRTLVPLFSSHASMCMASPGHSQRRGFCEIQPLASPLQTEMPVKRHECWPLWLAVQHTGPALTKKWLHRNSGGRNRLLVHPFLHRIAEAGSGRHLPCSLWGERSSHGWSDVITYCDYSLGAMSHMLMSYAHAHWKQQASTDLEKWGSLTLLDSTPAKHAINLNGVNGIRFFQEQRNHIQTVQRPTY